MKYYININHSTNHYHAINLINLAIVCEDGRELFLENISKAKFRKGVNKFLSEDNTERKFYSCVTAMQEVAFLNIIPDYYFRDLNFLKEYISEKVNSDFSVAEDPDYPQVFDEMTPLDKAKWMKKLHQFLINFELNLQIKQLRKKIGLDMVC